MTMAARKGRAAPRQDVAKDRREAQIYRLERVAGRGIIGEQRKNSAHLRGPWRAIEFHRKLDRSNLVRSLGRGAESSHQDCARAQLRWPVLLNFHLSQSRSPDAAIPARAKKESYPLRDVGADLGLQRL